MTIYIIMIIIIITFIFPFSHLFEIVITVVEFLAYIVKIHCYFSVSACPVKKNSIKIEWLHEWFLFNKKKESGIMADVVISADVGNNANVDSEFSTEQGVGIWGGLSV